MSEGSPLGTLQNLFDAQTRAEGAAFAVRCRVFVYAEDVVAVWVMLAVRHQFSRIPLPGPP